MSRQVYSNRHFKVYKTSKKGYIVHNTNKPFETGHTHVNDFRTAKYLTRLAVHLLIPNHLSKYLLESLLRLSTDAEYKEKIKEKL